jgi:hypothetical protein
MQTRQLWYLCAMTTSELAARLSAAPGTTRRDVRPPIEMSAAPCPGAAAAPLRRTALLRRIVTPHVWDDTHAGHELTDPDARRRWCALIGPGAVADLLRLATAATRGRPLPRPVNLETLARHGLVASDGSRLLVRATYPPVPRSRTRRLHPALRA